MTNLARRARRPNVIWAGFAIASLCTSSGARAHDVSDELTLGRLSSEGTVTPYWSERARGSVDASDELAFDLGMGVTHYAATHTSSAATILQGTLGGSYTPNDHWAFDVQLFGSPQNTTTQRGLQLTAARKGALRDKTSAFGFDLAAEYDTAASSDLESAFGVAIGATDYSTTQAVRLQRAKASDLAPGFGPAQSTSLLQWHFEGHVTETLFENTDLGMSASFFAYNESTQQSGYYGQVVFGRLALGDGIPIAPLLYALSPSVQERIGPVKLRAYVQFGEYRYGDGTSLIAGLKAQLKIVSMLRVWLSANIQHDEVDSTKLSVLWTSVGARLVF